MYVFVRVSECALKIDTLRSVSHRNTDLLHVKIQVPKHFLLIYGLLFRETEKGSIQPRTAAAAFFFVCFSILTRSIDS